MSNKMLSSKRNYWILGVLLSIVLLLGAYYVFTAKESDRSTKSNNTTTSQEPEASQRQTIRLVAMGDMLPHETVNLRAVTADGYNYIPFFAQVAPYLKSDLMFCNQESPSAEGIAVTGYPAFNAPIAFPRDLSKIGCNIINLANNHADDKGQIGIDKTRSVWDTLPKLAVAGTSRSAEEQNVVAYFTKDGVKFSFLSYTGCSNTNQAASYGLNKLTKDLTDKQLPEARANSDILLVSVHWCDENSSEQTAEQDTWAQYFAEKNVDVVIGTGPHFLRSVKRLPRTDGKETINWFSLGNFLSTQEQVNGLIGGIAVMDIDKKTHTITNLGFLPTYMHYEWTPAQKANNDYTARTNLMLYPLDQAAEPLARSLNGTTVPEQTDRVSKLMNTYTPVTMYTTKNYPKL